MGTPPATTSTMSVAEASAAPQLPSASHTPPHSASSDSTAAAKATTSSRPVGLEIALLVVGVLLAITIGAAIVMVLYRRRQPYPPQRQVCVSSLCARVLVSVVVNVCSVASVRSARGRIFILCLSDEFTAKSHLS